MKIRVYYIFHDLCRFFLISDGFKDSNTFSQTILFRASSDPKII